MTSLRTLLFLVGTALVSGSEVKINTFQPYSPYGIYRLPAEIAEKKAFSLGNIGIPNLVSEIPNSASLVPFPINGISGYSSILGGGEKADCDHSGYIISGQPAPIVIPETSKIPTWIEPILETKPLTAIPEAPALAPLVLPELPLKVEESAQAYVPYQAGEYFIETPVEPKIEEIKLLAPIPEAPVLQPFTFPEAPILQPYTVPLPIYAAELELAKIQEFKPLAEIPEAPVLPPFSLPELPLKVSYESAPIYAPCPPGAYLVEAEKEFKPLTVISEAPVLPTFNAPEQIYYVEPELIKEEVKPLGLIPEAPVLPPSILPELPLKVSVPEPIYIVAEPEPTRFEEVKPLAPIPEAPVLLPSLVPDAGYYIESPKFVEEIKPWVPIPEAPVLGPYTLPELPLEVSVAKVEPCEEDLIDERKEPEYIIDNKLPIPEAPVLPPLTLPAIPAKVCEEQAGVLYIPELPATIENSLIFKEPKIEELKPIPAAPELPPLAFNYAISPVSTPVVTKVIEEPAKVFFGGFEYPKLLSPEFCAHTVLKERVIPKFIEEANYKVVDFSVGSEIPFKAFNPRYVSNIPGHPAATYGLPVYSS